jgi:hypothetical protein
MVSTMISIKMAVSMDHLMKLKLSVGSTGRWRISKYEATY